MFQIFENFSKCRIRICGDKKCKFGIGSVHIRICIYQLTYIMPVFISLKLIELEKFNKTYKKLRLIVKNFYKACT